MKTMKLSVILLIATFAVVYCQPDKTFKEQITVEKGIKFGDGTIQLTAPTGGTTMTWATLTGKPATFPPDAHNHSTLYRPLTWVPVWGEISEKPIFFSGSYFDLTNKPGTIELNIAISQLGVLIIPKKTTAEIALLTPTTGSFVYDITLNVLKVGNGSVFKVLITAN